MPRRRCSRPRLRLGAGKVGGGERVTVQTRVAIRLPGAGEAKVLTVKRVRELDEIGDAPRVIRLRLTASGRALRRLGRTVSVMVRVQARDDAGALAPRSTRLRLAASRPGR